MATVAICLAIGGGLSYFLMQVVKMELAEAALSGAALCLVLFLLANFCVCFKASRVQALNEAISDVSQNFVREVDQCLILLKGEKRSADANPTAGRDEQMQQFLIYLGSLEILRKM